MIDANEQPTLCLPESSLSSLDVATAAGWLAIERSTRSPAPITPSLRSTRRLIETLQGFSILLPSDSLTDPTVCRSIYDPVGWRYLIRRNSPEELELQLVSLLRRLCSAPDADPYKNLLWHLLAEAEAEAYLAAQLGRYGLDPLQAWGWVSSMYAHWADLSLGRRRFVIWVSVKEGIAMLGRTGDAHLAHATVAAELVRKSRWLRSQEPTVGVSSKDYSFLPLSSWKRSLLLDIFLTEVMPIGEAYWTSAPGPTGFL